MRLMIVEKKKRRPRGASALGDFEAAKVFATTSEDERIAATRRKTEALRHVRLSQRAPAKQHS
jgi:hypothetical protein